ncbi:hypothetical protein M7I_0208 [Glarea lozoyensis 74030]|uniref:Uncharacterized protein n=1 Tax=Glarea lozoyensis (strain ATCC 74030 / MF5533) TaxID=1104152 RepID=H0ECR3_GLAL7|nr:hypothetical protein M7I_0208 [Glarea lozoyensis 74030]
MSQSQPTKIPWKLFKHMKGLNSGFDERFGAPNITSPNSGAYGNPYASPAVHSAPLQFVPGGHSRKASHDQDYVERKGDWQGHNLPFQRQIGSLPQTQMPTHQAYIPKSPAESHSTQFSMSPIQSAKNSPEYPSHLTSPTSATTANTSTTARTSPFTTPTVRAAPRYPPRTQQRNQGLGNTITSPIENETATNRAAYERSDFQRAEQERRERERRGEVIRPLEKFRKDHGRKKQWSPDTVEDEDSLW